jgi:hypothetical protein
VAVCRKYDVQNAEHNAHLFSDGTIMLAHEDQLCEVSILTGLIVSQKRIGLPCQWRTNDVQGKVNIGSGLARVDRIEDSARSRQQPIGLDELTVMMGLNLSHHRSLPDIRRPANHYATGGRLNRRR